MKKTEDLKNAMRRIAGYAAQGLACARFLCERHPVLSLAVVLCVPELFVIAMGMACTIVPQLLGASVVILVVCVLLWVAGFSWWIYVQACCRRGKHTRASRAKAQERGLR